MNKQQDPNALAQGLANSFSGDMDYRFREIVRQVPVGITILTGEDFVAQMANDTYLAIVDKTEEEFCGRSLFDSLTEVRPAVEPILKGVLHTGVPFHGFEFEVTLNRFGKKEQTFFNFVYHPLRESSGAIIGVIVVANEVTGTVNSKRALAQREAQFRNMVMQSPIAMTTFIGPDHIIELANTTMLKNIWRKELHEVQGKPALEVFPELKAQKFPELLKKVLATGEAYHETEAEAIVNSFDGSRRFYLDFEYAPLFDVNNVISGLMITVYDVTLKVEARKTLERAESVLAERVAEQTRELKIINESLMRSNSELLQFAYVSSHDLQEPLRKMQTFISRIVEMDHDRLSEKGRDYLLRVSQASERTQQLVKDLLAFSRINDVEKQREELDLNNVLRKVQEDLSELIERNAATVIVPSLPQLRAIGFQMYQLFSNLLINAIKFSRAGIAPVIHVGAETLPGSALEHSQADKGKAYLKLSVADNGIGFDNEFNERIFMVFQRLHNREGGYEGTGIGLAICKRIAENHHGFITAHGRPGEGAVFSIYIPL